MKFRVILILVLFFTAVSFINIFIRDGFLFIEKYSREIYITSIINGEPVKVSSGEPGITRLLIDYLSSAKDNFASILLDWNDRKLAGFILLLSILLISAFLFGMLFNIPYNRIILGVDEISKGNYNKYILQNGLYSELSRKLNRLSQKLANEEMMNKKKSDQDNIAVNQASDQLCMVISDMIGHAEVLLEAGIIAEDSQEGKLLDAIREKGYAAREIISDMHIN